MSGSEDEGWTAENIDDVEFARSLAREEAFLVLQQRLQEEADAKLAATLCGDGGSPPQELPSSAPENTQHGPPQELSPLSASENAQRRYATSCPFCNLQMPSEALVRHTSFCRHDLDQQAFEDKVLAISLSRQSLQLTRAQHAALQHVVDRAQQRASSPEVYLNLVARFRGLGFSERNLQRTLLWIRDEAPIIIHVDLPSLLPHLVSDTHYRNQFETLTSRGNLSHESRREWEKRLFGNAYRDAEAFDRVKYGVLNVVNDPAGVRVCRCYGDSILVLSHETRLRCSFSSKDSGYDDVTNLATTEYYTHILAEYDDQELQSVVEVANGVEQCARSDKISMYKEVQIHGAIRLDRDIEVLIAHSRHKVDRRLVDLIDTFSEKHACPVVWLDDSDVM